MVNNASLLEEMEKDRRKVVQPPSTKPPSIKSVFSQGANLSSNAYSTYDTAMGIKGNVEYLKDDSEEGVDRALGVTASSASLASVPVEYAKKNVQKDITGMADKILAGDKTKNITDIVPVAQKAGTLSKIGAGLGAVASVASFGKQAYDEINQSSALNTGRGFESAGDKVARGGTLVGSGVAAVAAVGTAIGTAAGSVAATNFWNPVGWVATGVALVASGIGWLAGKSKIGGIGRGNFLGKYKPSGMRKRTYGGN